MGPLRPNWGGQLPDRRAQGLRASSAGAVIAPGYGAGNEKQRIRDYFESPDLIGAMHWKEGQPVPWIGADRLDAARVDIGVRPELYNLDATPYSNT